FKIRNMVGTSQKALERRLSRNDVGSPLQQYQRVIRASRPLRQRHCPFEFLARLFEPTAVQQKLGSPSSVRRGGADAACVLMLLCCACQPLVADVFSAECECDRRDAGGDIGRYCASRLSFSI